MVAYNGVLDTLVAVAPKIRRNPAESGGFRRIVDHTYYVLRLGHRSEIYNRSIWRPIWLTPRPR